MFELPESLSGQLEHVSYSLAGWARLLGKKASTIKAWGNQGLKISDVSLPGAKRKTLLVTVAEMNRFFAAKSLPTMQPTIRRRQSRKGPAWDAAAKYFDLPSTTLVRG
jgi:hypothetical protein